MFSEFEEIKEIIDKALSMEQVKSNANIDKNVEYPYIRFRREDLITMLKLTSSMINLKSTQVVPKSITIVYDEDGYKMVVNNDLEYLSYRFEVLNEDNRLLDTICLPVNLISSIMKMMDEEIIIYKMSNSYYIRLLLQGDLYLELPKPESILLRQPTDGVYPMYFKEESGEQSNLVSCRHLYNLLKSIIPIVEEEFILDRKRITFIKDRAYYNSTKYYIEYMLPLPDMRVSLRFAEVLKRICNNYINSGVIKFNYSGEKDSGRVVIECEDVLFTTTYTKVVEEKNLINYLDRLQEYKQFIVSIKDMINAVSIANSLPNASGIVKLKLEENSIDVNIPISDKVTTFKVDVKYIDEDKSLKGKEIMLYADKFKKLLDSFSNEDEIVVSIINNTIVLNKGNLIGALEI